MKKNVIWALVMLNVALLTTLVLRATTANTAHAQAQGNIRRVGDVIMVPGQLPSGTSSVLYLVDVGEHQLSAMAYTGQDVEFLAPPLDLRRVFEGSANTVGSGGNTRERGGRTRTSN